MEIETVVTGALDENCYILKKNNTCLVIDPGSDYPKIKERIGNNKILGVHKLVIKKNKSCIFRRF